MELKIQHGLEAGEVRRRIEGAAGEHGVALTPDAGGLAGTLEKNAGFLGSVRARYEILERELVVTVLERPSMLPEGTLRSMLEAELARFLAK